MNEFNTNIAIAAAIAFLAATKTDRLIKKITLAEWIHLIIKGWKYTHPLKKGSAIGTITAIAAAIYLIIDEQTTIFKTIQYWILFNTSATLIVKTVLGYKLHTKKIMKALQLYEPLRNKKFSVLAEDIHTYLLKAPGCWISIEGLLKVGENLSNASGVQITRFVQVRNGYYRLITKPLKTTLVKGIRTSNVSLNELRFHPQFIQTRKFLFIKNKPVFNERAIVEIPIGINSNSQTYWNLERNPHLGIAGPPGLGKTEAINTILASAIKADPQSIFFLIDYPKAGAGFALLEKSSPGNCTVIRSATEFIRLMRIISDEVDKRNHLIVENQERTGKDYKAIMDIERELRPRRLPRIFVIFDELLFSVLVGRHDKTFRATYEQFKALMAIARAVKINFIVTSQEATKHVIGEIRDMMKFISFGSQPNETEYILKMAAQLPQWPGVFAMTQRLAGRTELILSAMPKVNSTELGKTLKKALLSKENEKSSLKMKALIIEPLQQEDAELIQHGISLLRERKPAWNHQH